MGYISLDDPVHHVSWSQLTHPPGQWNKRVHHDKWSHVCWTQTFEPTEETQQLSKFWANIFAPVHFLERLSPVQTPHGLRHPRLLSAIQLPQFVHVVGPITHTQIAQLFPLLPPLPTSCCQEGCRNPRGWLGGQWGVISPFLHIYMEVEGVSRHVITHMHMIYTDVSIGDDDVCVIKKWRCKELQALGGSDDPRRLCRGVLLHRVFLLPMHVYRGREDITLSPRYQKAHHYHLGRAKLCWGDVIYVEGNERVLAHSRTSI